MDMIIPTNLVCVLFDPAIPTLNYPLFLYLYKIYRQAICGKGIVHTYVYLLEDAVVGLLDRLTEG